MRFLYIVQAAGVAYRWLGVTSCASLMKVSVGKTLFLNLALQFC